MVCDVDKIIQLHSQMTMKKVHPYLEPAYLHIKKETFLPRPIYLFQVAAINVFRMYSTSRLLADQNLDYTIE